MTRIGAALSRTPEGDLAAVEAADEAAAALDGHPCDVALVFASRPHVDALAAIGAAVAARLDPGVLVGAVADGVVGPAAEVEEGHAVSVWAAHLDGGDAAAVRTWALPGPDGGMAVAGWPDTRPDDLLVLLSDPFSYPVGPVIEHVGRQRPGHRIVGGLVSGGREATRLLLGDTVHGDGAVGVVLRDVAVDAVVSQGCRPVGEPLTVTGADGNVLLELGGEGAIDRLRAVMDGVSTDDRRRLEQGINLGIVVDGTSDDYDTGDFLIRAVVGLDTDRGGVVVGDVVGVGDVVQFQLRDPETADRDLRANLTAPPRPTVGGLLFTCNGRGQGLFGVPDHDVAALNDARLGPVAGAFCAGEIGPVGDRSYLHGFTASMALFRA
jgi:small ligand-binding sensory domain FIST